MKNGEDLDLRESGVGYLALMVISALACSFFVGSSVRAEEGAYILCEADLVHTEHLGSGF